MANASPLRRTIGVLILLVLLVAFPLLSWYYLKQGFNYYKAAISELDTLGNLPPLSWQSPSGRYLDTVELSGKVVLLGFAKPGDAEALAALQRVHAQFDDRGDVVTCWLLPTSELAAAQVAAAAFKPDTAQWHYVPLADSLYEVFVREKFGLEGPTYRNQAVLADTSALLRKRYDLLDEKALNRLVEHVSLIMPREAKEEFVYRPEKEK